MARAYSDIPKFKRLEAEIRKITRDIAEVTRKIDRAQEGKHTGHDMVALSRAKADWVAIHDLAKRALADFWDRVEGAE
ncbi:hypothetical protein K2X89_13895 [Myxococcota bacterium]|nr:hypothetical protein [Myxococcota bacterium]